MKESKSLFSKPSVFQNVETRAPTNPSYDEGIVKSADYLKSLVDAEVAAGVPAEKVYDERLYRALDKLLPHKAALEKHTRCLKGIVAT